MYALRGREFQVPCEIEPESSYIEDIRFRDICLCSFPGKIFFLIVKPSYLIAGGLLR